MPSVLVRPMTASKPHIDEAPDVGWVWFTADSEVNAGEVTLQTGKQRLSDPG